MVGLTQRGSNAASLLLLGTRGLFTQVVLESLLAGGLRPLGLVLAGRPSSVMAENPRSLPVKLEHAVERIARQAALPVAYAADGEIAMSLLPCQHALLACFPFRLTQSALAMVPAGVFNLHPSRLPAWRGPSPLFWQFRAGATATAVSLHRVDGRLDTGAVVARSSITLAAGDCLDGVNRRLAALGAGLAMEHLAAAKPSEGEAQSAALASYQPLPVAADFAFTHQWSAERAYRFVCGTAAWGGEWRFRAQDAEVRVFEADGFDADAVQAKAVSGRGGRLHLRMRPGLLRVRGERMADGLSRRVRVR